ncbi:MAG: gliding motility protein GldL [Bacteroidetes bacterium]|nr:gliding motility protein GldL [Bacteroidota bacterium]MBU1717708.1 gliding motility protein GldL [Bacteroidota bacterium]
MARFNETKAWKNLMAKLYGIGASIVIIGALFKIQHWAGAGEMLICGLSTEAVIFFFSAFEKPHAEPDWSLVYPELAGMDDHLELEDHAGKKSDKTLTQELDQMLEDAKIGPELIQSLSDGMKNLGENALKLSGVADAAVATDGYVSNLNAASDAVGELSGTYTKTNEVLRKDAAAADEYAVNLKNASDNANQLAGSFGRTAGIMDQEFAANQEYLTNVRSAADSAKTLADNYVKSAESITKSADAIDFSKVDGQAYAEQLQKVSKNLGALNSVYELQLKEINAQSEQAAQMQQSVQSFIDNLQNSTTDTKKFNEGVAQLAQNISTLNGIYGNMLAAMSVR